MTLHQVLINDVDRTQHCLGWEVTQSASSAVGRAIVHLTLDITPAIFDTVELKGGYGGSLYTVFKGVVAEFEQTLEGKTYRCTCLDYGYWLQFRKVFEEQYVGKKAHEIIQDLVTTYFTDITTTNLATNFTTLYDTLYDDRTVLDILQELAEAEDADFYIDESKDLYFKKKADATTSGIVLTQGVNIFSASRRRTDNKLFNWLRFVGSEGWKPNDRDAWTENSGWDQTGGALTYDGSVKKHGSYSVKATLTASGGTQTFWYPSAKDWGLSLRDVYERLYLNLRASYLTWTTLRVELHKDAGNYVHRPLYLTEANCFEEKRLPIGTGAPGWTEVGTFNWLTDPVNYIQIYHTKPADSTPRDIYVDKLYFQTPQVVLEVEDAASQTSYKRRDSSKTESLTTDVDWANKWAGAALTAYKDPYTTLSVRAPFYPGQVHAGQKIVIALDDFGISSETWRIESCRFTLNGSRCDTELQLSNVASLDYGDALSGLQRELLDLMRRTQ